MLTVASRTAGLLRLFSNPGLGRRGVASWGKGMPVLMPALSPTMTSGKLARWIKKEGDAIASGDVIAEVETDKATIDFTFQDDAILAKLLVQPGEEVAVGAPLALVVDSAADVEEVRRGNYGAAAAAPSAPPASAPAAAAAAPSSPAAAAPHASTTAEIDALPAHAVFPSARLLMLDNGVQPSSLSGSGKGGRITKGDVLSLLGRSPAKAAAPAAAARAAAPAAAATAVAAPAAAAVVTAPLSSGAPASSAGRRYTDSKPSTVRKVIAARLTESKARVPHQYAVMDCRLDAMLKLRVALKDSGINLSVNDMIVKAAAKALCDVPEANCYYDLKTDSVKRNKGVDVCVAVATDGGLLTPIIKGADALGLVAINEAVKDLAARARIGKLKPEEFQGGSFTISNLGMFGIDDFTAVINPPQACILAVGRGEKRVVLPPIGPEGASSAAGPVVPETATVMSVTLSADVRVADAAVMGQFLQAFRHYVQNPTLMVA